MTEEQSTTITAKRKRVRERGRYSATAAAYRKKHAKLLAMRGVWRAMVARCHNPKAHNFAFYGGRGITVCDRWRESFENFLADVGDRPGPDYTLDRRDNDGAYSPGNCGWATKIEQARNRRSNHVIEFVGVKKSLREWAETTGIPAATIEQRLRKLKWPVGRALTAPVATSRGEGPSD